MRSFSDFCAHLGCPLTNVRWSWCAISADSKRAIFTIWDDELKNRRYVLYPPTKRRPGEIAESVDNKLGAEEIFRVAKFAATHPDVEALGILSIAKDKTASARERKTYDDNTVFRLRVEEVDGEIIATTVARPTVASVLAGGK
jgi:5-methylcytosine-specific restriction protein A